MSAFARIIAQAEYNNQLKPHAFIYRMNIHIIKHRLHQYARLTRLDKPVGTLLLLWPTLWALLIASSGWPRADVLVVFVLGVILMRSAGCAINDFADRKIDPLVARTKDRPIASGEISAKEALIVFATLSLVAFGLVLFMNALTIYLSFVAVALAGVYPFMKRVTFMPQAVLGAAFSMAIPMAFSAQTNHVPSLAWLLFLTNLIWTVAYDTLYAMVDREDDLKAGVKSTAVMAGENDLMMVFSLQALFIMGLFLVGHRIDAGLGYYASVVVATGLIVYQFIQVKGRNRDACFSAFKQNNWVGLCVTLGLMLHYFLKV